MTAPESRGFGELLRGLLDGVTSLFHQELELAKTELGEKISQAAVGVFAIGLGALLAFAGIIVLLQALVIELTAVGIEPALAALIVGGGVILAGVILVLMGKRNLKPSRLAPERTARSLKRDAEIVQDRLS